MSVPCTSLETSMTWVVPIIIPETLCQGLGTRAGFKSKRTATGIAVNVAKGEGGRILGTVGAFHPGVCEMGVSHALKMLIIDEVSFPTAKPRPSAPAPAVLCQAELPEQEGLRGVIAPAVLAGIDCEHLRMHDVSAAVTVDRDRISGEVPLGCQPGSPDATYVVVEPSPGVLHLCTLQARPCVSLWTKVEWQRP